MPASILYPRPPYDFSLSAAIFARGDPQIRIFGQGIFRQPLEVGGIPVLVEVTPEGSVNAPLMHLSIHPESALPESGFEEVKRVVASMFGVNEDLTPFYQAMKQDGIMTALTEQLRGVKAPATPTI